MKTLTALISLVISSPVAPRKLTGAEVAQLASRIGTRNAVTFLLAAKAVR
jgi:hypothetical protein